MSVIRGDVASCTSASTAASSYGVEISVEESDTIGKPRMGLGSTANENIALRRNYREMELLWKTQKTLVDEEEYVLKLIDLYEKSVQLNYKRLTKRVKKIKSHLTEEEIIEMENDLRKKEFAEKYRMLLHNQEDTESPQNVAPSELIDDDNAQPTSQFKDTNNKLEVIKEEREIDSDETRTNHQQKSDMDLNKSLANTKNNEKSNKRKQSSDQPLRSQSCQVNSTRSNNISTKRRPETTPNIPNEESDAMNDIIPSLEGLLDQLHNIKPQQFYENQRKLKLYEIRLLEEELEMKKADLFKGVDQIINWDKKEEKEEEKEEEEEKPKTRKTSFMRSVIRNFSMELMMKTMQYGWTDLGQCRYLRNRGGDEDQDTSGANTLAKDTMKIKLSSSSPNEAEPQDGARGPDPGFDASGKMIRTADLLGLK